MRADVLANWESLDQLLDAGLQLEPSARRAWLDAQSGLDSRTRVVLERILGREPALDGFLDASPMAEVDEPAHEAGMEIGGYRLQRELGRGGMGLVWLAASVAVPDSPPVAIKLPFAGALSARMRERFERERRILASLNHPNIARFFEAGVSASDQPWLALEYIDGEPLPTYCESRGLGIRERVALFAAVLRGVQHAHAALVIHRDLKPTNILVTTAGDPKLLDFGIAKLLDQETGHAAQTELTQVHGRLMTLDYASPEQLRGEPLTTATDVYSLGVILCELLGGSKPYLLERGTRAELEEAILGGDRLSPSRAAARAGRDARTQRALRGDLDAIVLKALQADPALRYGTAQEFAADCDLYLRNLPVKAQPEARGYRLRKFLRRHRLALAAGGAVLLALLGGAGLALWQARLAVTEAAKQRAVQDFLTDLFDRNSRQQRDAVRARNMTVRDLLLEAAGRVSASMNESPPVKLELLNTLARLLRDIDEYEKSAELGRDAVALARGAGLTRSDAYVEALMGLVNANRLLGRGEEAGAARDESLRVLDERGEGGTLLRARASVNTLAQLAPDPVREMALLDQGARLFERKYPNEPEYFRALYVLGNFHRTRAQPVEAKRYFERALKVFPRVVSNDYLSFAATRAFLAQCEMSLGEVDAALRDYAAGVELVEKYAGPNALTTRFHRGNYANYLHMAGRLADSRAQFARALAAAPPEPGVAEFDNAVYRGVALLEEGRIAEARAVLEPMSAHWLEFGRRFAANGERWLASLAVAQALQGDVAGARSTLGRLPELQTLTPAVDFTRDIAHLSDVAWLAFAAADASAAWQSAGELRAALAVPDEGFSAVTVRAHAQLAEIAAFAGQPGDALRHARLAGERLRGGTAAGSLPFLEFRVAKAAGEAALAAGNVREALAEFEKAHALGAPLQAAESPWLLDLQLARASAELQAGNEPRARAIFGAAASLASRIRGMTPRLERRLAEVRRGID